MLGYLLTDTIGCRNSILGESDTGFFGATLGLDENRDLSGVAASLYLDF